MLTVQRIVELASSPYSLCLTRNPAEPGQLLKSVIPRKRRPGGMSDVCELTGFRLDKETPLPYPKHVKVPTLKRSFAGAS
jgi:hypothetical protein